MRVAHKTVCILIICFVMCLALAEPGSAYAQTIALSPDDENASKIYLEWEMPCFEYKRKWNPSAAQYEQDSEKWESALTTMYVTCAETDAPIWITVSFLPSEAGGMDAYFTPSAGINEYNIGDKSISFLAPDIGEYELLLRLANRDSLRSDSEFQQIGEFSIAVQAVPNDETAAPVPTTQPEPSTQPETAETAQPETEQEAEAVVLPEALTGRYYDVLLPESEQAWTLSDDTLPSGLMLSGDSLYGIPTDAPGDYSFSLTAGETSVCFEMPLTEEMYAFSIAEDVLPYAEVGFDYACALSLTDTERAWGIVRGTLPPGLSLTEDGQLSGTPEQAGVYTFLCLDSGCAWSDASCWQSIEILNDIEDDKDNVGTLPQGRIGQPYSATLPPPDAPLAIWSAAGLPEGLTLSSDGMLSGTAISAGDYAVSVTVDLVFEDIAKKTIFAEKSFILTVTEPVSEAEEEQAIAVDETIAEEIQETVEETPEPELTAAPEPSAEAAPAPEPEYTPEPEPVSESKPNIEAEAAEQQ